MTKRGRYPKGAERREEILAAAYDVLSRDGYRGASLNQIGRSIGLDSAHLLYYFRSRDHLLQEVLHRWDGIRQLKDDAELDIFPLWLNAVRKNSRHPGIVQLYTIYAAEAADPEHPGHAFFEERFATLHAALCNNIRRLQSDGSVPPTIDVDTTASLLISVSDGLQIRWLIDRSIDMEAMLRTSIEGALGLTFAAERVTAVAR
jgi:AcrR family transcriptional regulator